MKNIMVLVSSLLFTNIAIANEEQLIEDPKMVAELKTIQTSLDNVSTAVMACIESGGEHTSCLCQNKDVITHFNENVHSFFERNDHMYNTDLVRFKADDGNWVTQSLQGIQNKLVQVHLAVIRGCISILLRFRSHNLNVM